MLSDAGKPSISKSDLIVDEGNQTLSGGVGGKQILKQGDTITVDGSSGIVYLGAVPTVPAGQDEDYRIIMRWANKYKKLEVYAAADTFEDVKVKIFPCLRYSFLIILLNATYCRKLANFKLTELAFCALTRYLFDQIGWITREAFCWLRLLRSATTF